MLLSMAVMERERWTDERLDKSFDRIDADLREVRVEMRRGFEQIDDKLESMQSEMTKRFDSLQSESNLRFDAVQRSMMTWFVALFSTIVASLATGVFALVSLA
jgi:hypothetical protein